MKFVVPNVPAQPARHRSETLRHWHAPSAIDRTDVVLIDAYVGRSNAPALHYVHLHRSLASRSTPTDSDTPALHYVHLHQPHVPTNTNKRSDAPALHYVHLHRAQSPR